MTTDSKEDRGRPAHEMPAESGDADERWAAATRGGMASPREGTERPEQEALSFEAPALLRILWADPQHMPEHLALWSLKRFASRASSAVEKLRRARPTADEGELERMVIERQTRVAVSEGAFVGGPFIVLIPVAFCAALLAQAQMALELAALAGYAADDEMRAADLLVLQGSYETTAGAGEALGRVTRDPRNREGGRLPRGTRWSMIKRMAFMLGVLEPAKEKTSRLRSILHGALLGLVLVVGFVLPLVWVPYMALAVRRSALKMGDRAARFYAERRSVEAGVTVMKAPAVQVAITGGLVRMVALILLPLVVAAIAFSTDVDLVSGRLMTSGILLIGVSALATLAWLAHRRWRRGRRTAPQAA